MNTAELLFLGTGAADWAYIPADDVKYDTNKKIRRLSTVLISGKYLIDCSPFSFEYAKFLGVDLSAITDIFLTHSHNDHLNRESLLGFANASSSKIKFHCHKDAVGRIPLEDSEKELIDVIPFDTFEEITSDDIMAVAMPANHIVENSPEQAVHYWFRIFKKEFFYGCDGAWLLSRTWEFLMKKKLDLVIFDGTCGDYEDDYRLGTHNTIPMIRMMVKAFIKHKIITDNSKVMLNHLARTLHLGITETEELLAKDGFLMAYDSMKFKI